MVGNIGSGKSTYVKKLKDENIIISRDAIRYMFGDGKYVFDKRLEKAVVEANFTAFNHLIETGVNIVSDETNMNTWMREHYIKKAKEAGYTIRAMILPRLSKEQCVNRRMQNSHGAFSADIWEGVWQGFDDMYEIPTTEEGFDEIIMLNN